MTRSRNEGPSADAWQTDLTAPCVVEHRGRLVAFARKANAKTDALYFSVLDPQAAVDTADEQAWNGWYRYSLSATAVPTPSNKEHQAEQVPPQVRVAGMELLTVGPAATVAKPADADFTVVSQGPYLLVFRPAEHGSIYVDQLVLTEVQVDASGKEAESRFELSPAWEMRFKRSGVRDVPLDDTDTRAMRTPDGTPFEKPTVELTDITGAQTGQFAVAHIPTSQEHPDMWYVAVVESEAAHLYTLVQDDTSGIDFETSERARQTVKASLKSSGTALPALQMAPALAFWAEQEPHTGTAGQPVEVQRGGRLMLAFGVGAPGLDPSLVVYDFGIAANGHIAELPADEQAVVLADGEYDASAGTFTPDETSSSYPPPAKLANSVRMIDDLTVSAIALGQVNPHRSPTLRTGEDGLVHLYFGGPKPDLSQVELSWGALSKDLPQAMVAHFDTRVSRLVVELPWRQRSASEQPAGAAHLVAKLSGSLMDGAQVEVASPSQPAAATGELCDLHIRYPEALGWPDETWRAVPRQVEPFEAILNGNGSSDSADPRVLSGQRAYYDYTGTVPVVRTPLVLQGDAGAPAEDDKPFPPSMTVIPTRAELPIEAMVVSTSSNTGLQVAMTFVTDGGSAIELVWNELPKNSEQYPDIFAGTASPSNYDYTPGQGTTALFALNTDTAQLPAPLLFFATGNTPSADTLTIEVGAADSSGDLLDVTVRDGVESTVIEDLPAPVDKFVDALQASPEFQALHLGVSAEGVHGKIMPVGERGRLDLAGAAVLFDAIVPVDELQPRTLKADEYPAIEQGHLFSEKSERDITRMIGFHVSADRPDDGSPAYVQDTTDEPAALHTSRPHATRRAQKPEGGLWTRKPPQFALDVAKAQAMSVPVARDGQLLRAAHQLAPQWDWTLEAWLKPASSALQRVITFHDAVTKPTDANPPPDYRISTTGAGVVEFGSYQKKANWRDASYFQSGTSAEVDFAPDWEFTWEFWVKPDAQPAPSASGGLPPLGGIVQLHVPNQPAYLSIGLDANRRVVVRTRDRAGVDHDFTSNGQLTVTNKAADIPGWNHVAVVGSYDADKQRWALKLVLNGTVDATIAEVDIASQRGGRLVIGRNTMNGASVFGHLAQLRYWKAARDVSEIRSGWLLSLTGTEPSLLGCWPLNQIETGKETKRDFVKNISTPARADWDAYLEKSAQPVELVDDNFMLSVVASVGGLPAVEVPSMMINQRWNHLAVVYERGGALALNPPSRWDKGELDWASCAEAAELDAGETFGIDAWIQIPKAMTTPGTIMARWADSSDDEGRSYMFGVDEHGEAFFEVCLVKSKTGETTRVTATSSGAGLADAKPHHLAARFKTWDDSNDDETAAKYLLEIYEAGVSEPIAEATARVTGVSSTPVQGASSVPATLGRTNIEAEGASPIDRAEMCLFQGSIGRVRYWSNFPKLEQLFPELHPRIPQAAAPKGLVSEWNLREHAGRVARDSMGGNDFLLTSSAPWSAFAQTSKLRFVINGALIGTTFAFDGTLDEATKSQFRLGTPETSGVAGFDGQLARVALWGESRSPEMIRDRRFMPLVGDEPNLLAAWNFDGQNGVDITGGGNDADPPVDPKAIRAATAPISIEGPAIRNVYGERINEYHRSTVGRIAAGTYGDAARTDNGLRAFLKRAVILDPNWAFTPPLYVGQLDLTYIGQVQTHPTLIGYIEGAPPVPSENLTRPYYVNPAGGPYMRYLDNSRVTLTQNAATELSFGASKQSSTSVDFDFAIGLYWSYELKTLKGFIISKDIQAQSTAQLVLKLHSEQGTSEQQNFAGQWARTQADYMGLSGDWEPHQNNPDDYLNPTVGRRFVPDNSGYALVESLTADLYAMTYHATGASSGSIVLPNPSIPPDRNLLIFPMDDTYTKAGSLDGRIGLVDDPTSQRTEQGRGSYFKPAEAYELARKIDDQAQEARGRIEAFEARKRGQAKKRSLDEPVGDLPVDFQSEPSDEGQIGTPVEGIVNRYVWTAGGGLHSEQESFAATASRTYSGFDHFTGGGGFHGAFQAPVVQGSLDLLIQHSVDVSVSRQATDQQALGMQVEVDSEGYLRAWDPEAPAQYGDGKGAFLPGTAPGKVLAYRFMSFYLPPDTANSTAFGAVVDPVWKRLSNNSTARAMRQVDTSNPVWRVLHRVTYVEREPPHSASRPVSSPPTATRVPTGLQANVELLRLIDQALGSVTHPSPADIGQAVATVLNPASKDGQYPPAVLSKHVGWWADFLKSARPGGQDPEAAELLATLMRRVVSYCVDGYRTGAIPRLLAEPRARRATQPADSSPSDELAEAGTRESSQPEPV